MDGHWGSARSTCTRALGWAELIGVWHVLESTYHSLVPSTTSAHHNNVKPEVFNVFARGLVCSAPIRDVYSSRAPRPAILAFAKALL